MGYLGMQSEDLDILFKYRRWLNEGPWGLAT